jgi:hypothetical protein
MMKTLLTICFAAVAAMSFADDCGGNCCGGKMGVKPFDAKDAQFLTLANEMMMASEKQGGACCKMEAKVAAPCAMSAKATKGHKMAKKSGYKVFVSGNYEMFDCPDSAEQARAKYAAMGIKVGKVQKLASK